MHIHRFTIDETARGPARGVWHHTRWFLTIYRREDGPELFAGHLETIIQAPKPEFSARFHVGTAASETPFDGHLTILGTGLYWGTSIGRRLADRITREQRHPYEGRDVKLAIHDGTLWLSAWVHSGIWERGEFARWRSGYWSINPLTIAFGERRYWYEDVDVAPFDIELPEGSYPVTATLQKQLFGRPKLSRRTESWTVHVEAPKGIPSHHDPSGGWKGDRTYGFGVGLTQRRKDWPVDAKAAITAWILRRRADSGFREAQELEETR